MKASARRFSSKFVTLISWLLVSMICFGQTISLSPKVGPPTITTLVSGSGFPPGASVRIFFDEMKLAVVHADSTGAFSNVSIQVPASALPGRHRIFAGVLSGGTLTQTAFLVRTNWSQFHFSPDHSGYNQYENVLSPVNVANLGVFWKYTTGNGIYSSPAVTNGVVYVGSWGNGLYALNASTGAVLWNYTTVSYVDSSPAVANGVVYVAVYGSLYALNASTGALLWNYTPGCCINSSPAVASGVAYLGSGDSLYALNASTGALLWKYTTGSELSSSPAVANGVVYVGSFYDNSLNALNASTGALLWKYTTGGHIDSSPAVANGVVYVGSWDNSLYALNASTGAVLWGYTTGAISSSPAVANGVVYVGSFDYDLYAFGVSGAHAPGSPQPQRPGPKSLKSDLSLKSDE